MNLAQSGGFEHVLMMFYIHNIVIALPLTLLVIKIAVRFVIREPAKDIFRSLLTLPLDFVYVAMGLMLAGIARRIPAFATHYKTDKEADFAGAFFLLGLFVVACFITSIDRFVRLLWQKFYAAWNLSKEFRVAKKQLVLPDQTPPEIKKMAIVYIWIFTYWAMMVPFVFLEVVLGVECLGGILKRLQ
jgi:hypothetical protein